MESHFIRSSGVGGVYEEQPMNQTSLSRSYYYKVVVVCFTVFLISSCAKELGDEEGSILSSGTHINQPPNAVISKPVSNITLTKGNTYTFTGSAVDPEGSTNLLLVWDFDGYTINSTGPSKTVVFDRWVLKTHKAPCCYKH